jgi:hypothetical protein
MSGMANKWIRRFCVFVVVATFVAAPAVAGWAGSLAPADMTGGSMADMAANSGDCDACDMDTAAGDLCMNYCAVAAAVTPGAFVPADLPAGDFVRPDIDFSSGQAITPATHPPEALLNI